MSTFEKVIHTTSDVFAVLTLASVVFLYFALILSL